MELQRKRPSNHFYCNEGAKYLFVFLNVSFSFFQASEEESGKPFQCPICGLVIKRKSYWKRHMVIHTGLKSHQCPLCPFRCARKDNLKSHMKVSHPGTCFTQKASAARAPAHGTVLETSQLKEGASSGACAGQHTVWPSRIHSGRTLARVPFIGIGALI